MKLTLTIDSFVYNFAQYEIILTQLSIDFVSIKTLNSSKPFK